MVKSRILRLRQEFNGNLGCMAMPCQRKESAKKSNLGMGTPQSPLEQECQEDSPLCSKAITPKGLVIGFTFTKH